MANITLTNLPTVTSINGTEPLLGVQSSTSVQITTGQIASYAGALFGIPTINTGTLLGNISGVSAIPTGLSLTQFLDYTAGAAQGDVLYRADSGWTVLTPGIAGQALTTNGPNANIQWRSTTGIGTVISVTAGTNLSATPANPITASGTINVVANPTFATSVTSPLYIATKTISTTATTGAYSYGTLTYSDTNIFASYQTSVNSYAQVILANTSNGAAASTDFIVGNDLTTAGTYYGDFGMNSSGFTGTGSLNTANNVFLSSTSADLVIGTTTSNAIRFVVNNGATDAMTIASDGTVTIPNAAIDTTSLTVPIVYGGTAASSSLTLQSTSGAGTTDSIIFKVGNAGATTALTIGTGTTANFTFGGTAQRFLADFDNATVTSRFAFQTKTANASTGIYALPNGTSTAASWQATNAADPTNASKVLIATNGSTDVQLVSGRNGTGTYLPLSFFTSNTGQFAINASGAWGIGSVAAATVNYGSSGQVFTSGGSAAQPTWSTLSSVAVTSISFGTTGLTPNTATQGAVTVAGTLVAANGGTGQSSYAVGDILYASATTTLSKLAAVATGSVLVSQGVTTAPAYSSSPTLTTSLTVPVVYGGSTSSSSLTLQSTSGAGTTDSIVFKTGSAGAVTALTIASNGNATFLSTSTTAIGTLTLTNALGPTYGGTGQNAVTTGDLLYGSATNTWARLADVATGSVLVSGGVGVAPAWSASPTVTTLNATTVTATAGAGFQNMVVQTTGSSASYSLPAALQVTGAKFRVTVIGGGAGGGGTNVTAGQAGGGGGSGAVGVIYLTYVAGQNTLTYTVGAAVAAAAANAVGNNGNASSIVYNSLTYTAGGGTGGTNNGAGGAGGTTSGTAFTLSITGQAGAAGGVMAATSNYIPNGGDTPLGYGSGGRMSATAAGGAGSVGAGYGSGGSGARNGTGTTSLVGGGGNAGVVIIEY